MKRLGRILLALAFFGLAGLEVVAAHSVRSREPSTASPLGPPAAARPAASTDAGERF